jgi:hypothetical protein
VKRSCHLLSLDCRLRRAPRPVRVPSPAHLSLRLSPQLPTPSVYAWSSSRPALKQNNPNTSDRWTKRPRPRLADLDGSFRPRSARDTEINPLATASTIALHAGAIVLQSPANFGSAPDEDRPYWVSGLLPIQEVIPLSRVNDMAPMVVTYLYGKRGRPGSKKRIAGIPPCDPNWVVRLLFDEGQIYEILSAMLR